MQTQDSVARRAAALCLISLRSQADNGISYGDSDRDRFRELGEGLVRWAKEQGVDQWLSKEEKKLHRKALGKWTHGEIAERFWRIESMKALLWAIRVYAKMPTYHEVGDVNGAYDKVPYQGDISPFLAAARLRNEKEIEAERHRAKFLNWRCRTEVLRLEGMRPPKGDSYEKVVARALDEIDDDIPVDHDGKDILVDGVRFRDLDGDVKGNMMSVCYERHLALQWVSSEDDWDDARADS
ncbi:MAG TPA: DUF4272 domain-containing protein [Gemmataceae bacterium]|nr:DUF4272 domain-containing protein [Gemmataceae bacterium]